MYDDCQHLHYETLLPPGAQSKDTWKQIWQMFATNARVQQGMHVDSDLHLIALTCNSWLQFKSRKRSCFSLDSTGGTLVSRLSLRLRAVKLVSLDKSGRCILMATAVGTGAPDSLCSAKPVACTSVWKW